jgi:hypothetical protein
VSDLTRSDGIAMKVLLYAAVVLAMIAAFIVYPAILADGVAWQNEERAGCLERAVTGAEISRCR